MFDIYKIFDLPQNQFSINLEDLEKKYIDLQKKYHPDAARTQLDKIDFVKKSADINSSFSILKNDYQRASYILKTNNIDIQGNEYRHYLDPKFMVDILEKSEILETLEGQDELLEFYGVLKSERKNLLEKISAFIESEFKSAALETIKLRYFDNLIEKTNNKLEKCF